MARGGGADEFGGVVGESGRIPLAEYLPKVGGPERMARGDLMEPSGGGGQEILGGRVPQAPNFVGMYGEAVRAALEPVEFRYNYLAKQQELAETQRSNIAKETQAQLDLAQRARDAAETGRHNLVDEQIRFRASDLEDAKEKEIERHNKADEEHQKAQETYWTALAKETDARIAEQNTKNQEAEMDLDQRKTNAEALSELRQTLLKFQDSPKDFLQIDENPELKAALDKARSQIRGPDAWKEYDRIMGDNTALAHAIKQHEDMDSWGSEGHSAFIDVYNQAGPSVSQFDRWNAAYKAGMQANSDANAKGGFSYNGMQEYTKGITQGLSEHEAVLRGMQVTQRDIAEASGKEGKGAGAAVKPLSADVIKTFTDALPAKEGESPDATDARRNKVYLDALAAEQANPGSAVTLIRNAQAAAQPDQKAAKDLSDKLRTGAKPPVTPPPAASIAPPPPQIGEVSEWLTPSSTGPQARHAAHAAYAASINPLAATWQGLTTGLSSGLAGIRKDITNPKAFQWSGWPWNMQGTAAGNNPSEYPEQSFEASEFPNTLGNLTQNQ